MIRKAGKMQILKGCNAEYKKRHDEIWPDMVTELKAHGYSNYSIYLDEDTDTLFYYFEADDKNKSDKMSQTETCRKWWHYMKDIMVTNEDESPLSTELKEVFYLK